MLTRCNNAPGVIRLSQSNTFLIHYGYCSCSSSMDERSSRWGIITGPPWTSRQKLIKFSGNVWQTSQRSSQDWQLMIAFIVPLWDSALWVISLAPPHGGSFAVRDGHGSGRPAGRVGSGRGSESRQIWRVGSGRIEISEMHYVFSLSVDLSKFSYCSQHWVL